MQQPDAIPPFIFWRNGFTAAELDAIVALGDRLREARSTVAGSAAAEANAMRVSRNAWIDHGAETEWLYARMAALARTINDRVFRFALNDFSEPFQFATYRAEERAHFDWHMDQVPGPVHRKLSFTLQLSEPSDYEGGDLEFNVRQSVDAAPRERGMLVAFPAYILHRVSPVTAGVRRSMVVWTKGPRFR